MARANPNPICPVCGANVRAMDYYITGTVGQKLASRWRVECYKSDCASFGSGTGIVGSGTTIKEARDDYRAQTAKVADHE